MAKPAEVPRWCDTPTTLRTAPPEALKNVGAPVTAKWPAQYLNWLHGLTGDWLTWITSLVDFTDGIAVTGHVTATDHIDAANYMKPTSAQDARLTANATSGLSLKTAAGDILPVEAGAPIDYNSAMPRYFLESVGKWLNGALAVGAASVLVPWDGANPILNRLSLEANGKIMPGAAAYLGVYEVHVLFKWSNKTSAATRTIHVKLNGTDQSARADGNTYSALNGAQCQELSTLVRLTAGATDYIQVYAESTLAGDGLLAAEVCVCRKTGDISQ